MNGTIQSLDAMTTDELTTLKAATQSAIRRQLSALLRRPSPAERAAILADHASTRAFLLRVDEELFRRGA